MSSRIAVALGCGALAFALAQAATACAVTPVSGAPVVLFVNPYPDFAAPTGGRAQTVVEVEVELSGAEADCIVAMGLGSIGHPAPSSASVDQAFLIRQTPGTGKSKSMVLPWIAQTRGALIGEGDVIFQGAEWFEFAGRPQSPPAFPLRPGEIFSLSFAISVDAAQLSDLVGLPIQFATVVGPPPPPGGSANPFAYFGGGELPECLPTSNALCLNRGRFQVEVDWRTASGSGHAGVVVPAAADSGNFYFFHPDNWELTLKVLDACSFTIQPRYWVFFSAGSNVEYTIKVTDTQTGRARQYFNPQGRVATPVLDIESFDTCP